MPSICNFDSSLMKEKIYQTKHIFFAKEVCLPREEVSGEESGIFLSWVEHEPMWVSFPASSLTASAPRPSSPFSSSLSTRIIPNSSATAAHLGGALLVPALPLPSETSQVLPVNGPSLSALTGAPRCDSRGGLMPKNAMETCQSPGGDQPSAPEDLPSGLQGSPPPSHPSCPKDLRCSRRSGIGTVNGWHRLNSDPWLLFIQPLMGPRAASVRNQERRPSPLYRNHMPPSGGC